MSALAVETQSVNLGQGFPDTDGPEEVAEAARQAIRDGHNQYPPLPGIPSLREAVSEHAPLPCPGVRPERRDPDHRRCYRGTRCRHARPHRAGRRGRHLRALLRLLRRRYRPEWRDSPGGHPPRSRLGLRPRRTAGCVHDEHEGVPSQHAHNPTGKVFTRDELALIAELCCEHDVVAVTDEVYEHLVFDGEHHALATFPGMAERTLTVSSAGKIFSFTGWKVGWACVRPISSRRSAPPSSF